METLENSFALLFGVGDPKLSTVKDAQAICNLLVDSELSGYKEENIIMVVGEDATRDGILAGLDELIKKTDENSSILIYYSGHGGTCTENDLIRLRKKGETPKSEEENKKYFFLEPVAIDVNRLEETWVDAEEFKNRIRSLKSKKLILFFDCCHAEGMTKSSISLTKDSEKSQSDMTLKQPEGLVKSLDSAKEICIVSSCKDDQLSYQLGGDPNGLFTMCLLEVLRGRHSPNFREPYVRMTDAVKHIMQRVPEREPKQTPFANLQMYSNFILTRVPSNLNKEEESNAVVSQTAEVQDKSKEPVNKEGYYRKTESSKNLIVLVHGFSGQANDTFGFIPSLLIDDKEVDGWDIIPFGYSKFADPDMGNNVWASLYNIKHAADNLTASIKYQFSQYHRIALISHGVGGLVVQKSILDLPENDRFRISNVVLFASPNNGVPKDLQKTLKNPKLEEISEDSAFIKELRSKWSSIFKDGTDFQLKSVAATNDEYIPVFSSLYTFNKENQAVVAGNHFSMVDIKDRKNDTYNIIVNELTNNKFYNQFTSKEEINILLGEYESVVHELLPQKETLNVKGLKNLIFALEGLDRRTEVMDILSNHPLAQNNSDVMGLLAGRYKRQYLKGFKTEDGQKAIEFYTQGLEIATKKENIEQIYYHAINLAFLSLVFEEDKNNMRDFARTALTNAKKDSFDSLWKKSTIAEAELYLGNFDTAKENYKAAAAMSGIREKISIYTNAYPAYCNLMNTTNEKDDFIKFLNNTFLR